MNEQTSKERVLRVYPDAQCWHVYGDDWRVTEDSPSRSVLLTEEPQPSADAASRLTETKLPSSPAGDCFPYSPTSMAAAVGYVAEDKKPTQPLDENQLWGSPAGEIAVCAHCELPFKKCKCEPTKPLLTKWIPEPLGDISGPKGSGGAAPEAAEDKCILCFGEGGEYHAELRSGRHLYGLCEECADLWDGSAEEPQLMTRGEKIVPAEDGADYFTHPRSAAPIAPAAQDGISLIATERARQTSEEGWSAEHDDIHVSAELTRAAMSYADSARRQLLGASLGFGLEKPWAALWPWSDEWWKPSPDPIRNLVKAGALIAAEIDRLKRKEPHV